MTNTRKFQMVGGFKDGTPYVEIATDSSKWRLAGGIWYDYHNELISYSISFAEGAVKRGVWEEVGKEEAN